LGAAMALPYNAENINDTIYVANWGGLKPGNISNCFIRVYDATNPSNVHLLTYINAGLWHFDMTVHYPKMYVASEWYGIKTIDITDIMNPVDEGNTLTGGWNISADSWSNYMTVADEGYGFKLYDISDPFHPSIVKICNDPGFCMHANFSEDGQYIYAANMTTQPLRVYKRDSMKQISFLSQAVCNGRFIVHHQRIFSKLDNKILIINVGDPYNPVIDSTVNVTFNDMALSGEILFVTANDSIFAYDVSGNNFKEIAETDMATNQDAQMLAAFNNKIYVYITNKGLTRYQLVFNNPGYSLNEEYYSNISNGAPTYMAADTLGLYLAYRLKGLFALNRQTFVQTGFYHGGLDYRKYTTMYGVQDLFCKNDKIFFVEYFAQTSILSNDTLFTGIYDSSSGNETVNVFPNPASGYFTIKIKNEIHPGTTVKIMNMLGEKIIEIPLISDEIMVDTHDLPAGIYILGIFRTNNRITVRKIVIQK
jgi:hypothetical protein